MAKSKDWTGVSVIFRLDIVCQPHLGTIIGKNETGDWVVEREGDSRRFKLGSCASFREAEDSDVARYRERMERLKQRYRDADAVLPYTPRRRSGSGVTKMPSYTVKPKNPAKKKQGGMADIAAEQIEKGLDNGE